MQWGVYGTSVLLPEIFDAVIRERCPPPCQPVGGVPHQPGSVPPPLPPRQDAPPRTPSPERGQTHTDLPRSSEDNPIHGSARPWGAALNSRDLDMTASLASSANSRAALGLTSLRRPWEYAPRADTPDLHAANVEACMRRRSRSPRPAPSSSEIFATDQASVRTEWVLTQPPRGSRGKQETSMSYPTVAGDLSECHEKPEKPQYLQNAFPARDLQKDLQTGGCGATALPVSLEQFKCLFVPNSNPTITAEPACSCEAIPGLYAAAEHDESATEACKGT